MIASIIIMGTAVILTTLVVKRINRDKAIYRQMKVDFRQWLSQFDDPNTHD